MKNSNLFSLAFTIIFCISNLTAQIELKVSPLGLLFDMPRVSVEYIFTDELAVELDLGVNYSNFQDGVTYSMRASGKCYLGEDKVASKWYTGLYAGPKSRSTFESNNNTTIFGAGLLGGYKFIGKSGILLELGFGVGRAFGGTNSLDLDGFGKVALGYRF